MKETKVKKDQIPINFNFISHKSFENYIVGKDNIIIEILKKSSNSESPSIVFLSGKKSSGKSHLCYAVISLSNKSTYFVDEFNIKDIDCNNSNMHDLLIIDNIDKIISEHNLEEKLFILINDFILNKKCILVTSTIPLNKIQFKLPDLTSRLKWDQILEIPELTDEDKIKVLKKNAIEKGWILPDNVSDYIIRHYRRDLYFLCNCIKFIDEASLSLKKKITIPFIKNIIEYK